MPIAVADEWAWGVVEPTLLDPATAALAAGRFRAAPSTDLEAARLAHEIGARLAVPMHFEMFAFNTEPPDAFVAACERLGQPYRVLRAGQGLLRPR